MTAPALRACQHQLTWFRRNWRIALSAFVQPTLTLLGFGVGVGALIQDERTKLAEDVSYLGFVAPGLLVAACFLGGASEGMWGVTNYIKWNRGYHAMLASPLTIGDVIAGHVVYLTVRVLVSAVAMALVVLFVDDVRGPGLIGALCAGVLAGLAVAVPFSAFAAYVERTEHFLWVQRFVLTPLYLFGGVFYPLEQLPAAVRPLAWFTPLWHGVELARGSTLGGLSARAAALHIGVLLAMTAVGVWFARVAFKKRLTP